MSKRSGWTHVPRDQVLLESVLGRTQEVDVGSLASELPERVLALIEACRRDDGDLEVPLELLDELDEVGAAGDSSEIGSEGDVEVCLEGDVVEEHGGGDVDLGLGTEDGNAGKTARQEEVSCAVEEKNTKVEKTKQQLSWKTYMSEAVSLFGKRTTLPHFFSISWMKIDFSPRRVRWYRRGIETVSTV